MVINTIVLVTLLMGGRKGRERKEVCVWYVYMEVSAWWGLARLGLDLVGALGVWKGECLGCAGVSLHWLDGWWTSLRLCEMFANSRRECRRHRCA